MKTQGLILFAMVSLLMAGCTSGGGDRLNPEIELPYYNEATFTPLWLDTHHEKYDSIHTIADFRLVDQNGDTVSNQTLDGKIYIANFFFTICPSVCPKMMGNMTRVHEEFLVDDRVKIVSHTVMPWVDSVERLSEYARLNEINNDQWHLLTGDQSEIYDLARTSYFADEGFGKSVTSSEDFLHTENIILIDHKRRIRGIYNGTIALDMKRIIDDINTLLKEV